MPVFTDSIGLKADYSIPDQAHGFVRRQCQDVSGAGDQPDADMRMFDANHRPSGGKYEWIDNQRSRFEKLAVSPGGFRDDPGLYGDDSKGRIYSGLGYHFFCPVSCPEMQEYEILYYLSGDPDSGLLYIYQIFKCISAIIVVVGG